MGNRSQHEALLADAVKYACEQDYLCLEQAAGEYSYTFSEEFEQKMKDMFCRKAKKNGRKMWKYLLIAAALFLLSASAVLAGEELQVWLGNTLVEFFDSCVSIGDGSFSAETAAEEFELYPLHYLPEGYEQFCEMSHPESHYSVEYVDGQGNIVIYYQAFSAQASVSLIYDEGTGEQIKINSADAWFISGDGINSVFFEAEGYIFTVSSSESREQVIKMAESILNE